MYYIIKLDQGDYYEERGGNDWGRTSREYATRFNSFEQARQVADHLKSFGAEVVWF